MSKAFNKMLSMEKKLKQPPKFSSNPREAKLERKMYNIALKAKKEGIQ